ncbi:MAG: uroporphyrinogen-III C-methyltransferase [Gammaproteobacteria bacterium]|nr:uroporphyrinogen-III C-methyltransferase [Gammaproteobacteria bacterium]
MSDKPEQQSDESDDSKEIVAEEAAIEVVEEAVEEKPAEKPPETSLKPRRGFPWFGVFNFLLILMLTAAAGYYWQLQQKTEAGKQAAFLALKQEIASKAESSQIQSGLRPLQSGMDEIARRIEALQQHQKDLQASSEKLYELFGRDESGWQLAEVEYLMRIAQHKLILENDFEGAAITLQAASDLIASTGDLGLLPVRVKISDEIAELKTRKRADLVGMTLKLSQLAQQIRVLKPGFQPRIEESSESVAETEQEASIEQQVKTFFSSLISVKRDTAMSPTQTEALIIDVGQTLEDNLKLTRWSVLERDAFQYSRLMKENVELFQQYYNLDDAANHDFYSQLQDLQKAEIKPEKPDINGSLEMLKRVISKRDEAEKVISEDADNV